MNAAARALAGGNLAPAGVRFRTITISSQMLGLILLVVAVLASAVAVVYVKNLDRQLFGDLQSLKQTRSDLHMQNGQLLLEQNTLATPARVQAVAQQQLGMGIPATKDINVVTLTSH
jgi:cell division protein FtsL